jgi:hypothetical protein
MDETGYITRPRLRAAYEHIWNNNEPLVRMRASEAFLRMIQRLADHRGITFDQCAEQLGY